MSPKIIGVIGIVLLLVLILLRVSVGLSLFLVGFVGVSMLSDWNVGLSQLGASAFGSSNNYGLSVIPMFILTDVYVQYRTRKKIYLPRWINGLVIYVVD